MNNTVKLNSIHFCGEILSDLWGAVTSYGYTAWGTQSSQSVTKTVGDVLYTVSEAYGYNGATKKLESETDSFGNTTAYGYNSDLWLTDITDANGNKTGYIYSRGELATQYADVNKNGVCDEGEHVVGYTYDAWGNITAVETETASYTFAYNSANLPLAVYVEGNEAPLVTYLYNSTLTETTGIQYANGLTVTYEYDAIGNVSKVLENGVAVAEYEYDSNMNLISAAENGAETKYCYDEAGTLIYTSKTCNGHTVVTYSETDEETGTTEYITKLDGAEIVYKSVYDEENDISKYILPNLAEITSDEDDFGRTSHVYLKDSAGENILSCTYAYVDKQVGDKLATSEYISSMTYTNGKSYTYTYDAVGNITSVFDGTYTTSYVYDSLYQLVRENNEKLDTTWTYTYDTAGNILAKTEYDYTVGELGTATDTVTYTYDSTWGDQLVNYDGTAITYDAQGNPLNWRDGLTFAWNGRELSSITDDTKVYTYEYNADGIRTKTTITDMEDPDYLCEYEYILDENNNVIAVFKDGSAYGEYYFDESGSPIGYRYNNRNYWYTKNLQGDITRVESEDRELYVEYDYDAWGNFTVDYSTSQARLAIERVNIYTYRGYIYDRDTSLYYLQSRYYDPAVGRFINADDISYLGYTGTLLSYNLYAYCENNCVNFNDLFGTSKWGLVAVGLQLEFNIGAYTHGYEMIFTYNKGIKAYLFKYKGGGIGGNIIDTIINIAKGITKNWKNLFSISLSLCFMAIFSTKKFDPKTYTGYFDTAYAVTPGSILGWRINTKMFYSSFGKYRVAGVGFTNSSWDVGYSRVYYTNVTSWLKSLGNYITNIYNTIYNKVKNLKP